MQIPKTLHNTAKEFWTENAKNCTDNGTLLNETKTAFILLCQLWQRYCEAQTEGQDTIKIVCLSKQVQQLMKEFGMTPLSRKKLGLAKKKSLSEVRQSIIKHNPYGKQTEED